MRQYQQDVLTMWRAVRQHLDAYHSIWSGNAPFVNASNGLTGAISQARYVLSVQSISSTGFTNRSRELLASALRQVLAIARCAKVFALDRENHELFAAVNYGGGYLRNYRQNELSARLRSMVRAAIPYREGLREYGVLPGAYESALEAIDSAETAQSLIRKTIARRKAVTRTLPGIFSSGRLALLKMDNLMHLFEPAEPAFVSGYRSIRVAVHTGVRHRTGGGLTP